MPKTKNANTETLEQSKKYEYERITGTYNGQRKEFSGKTFEDAIKKKIEYERALESGEIGLNKHMTVSRWAATWLETYKKNNVTAKTYSDYLMMLKNRISPAIGSFRLKDVTDIHLQNIVNEMAGMSHSRAKKLIEFIKALFKQARISRLITWDPAEALIMPKTTKGTHRSITPFEREYILKVCERHRAGLWVKTILHCGLRPGETFALDWRHIDFKKSRVNVEYAKESGSNDIKDPKSAAGIRSVPIPADLLMEYEAAKGMPFDPVFTQPTTGKRHTETSARGMWKNFKRELDIEMGAKVFRNQIVLSLVAPDLVPYCLRHTFGTDLQDTGVPINVAKYLMGHSDIRVTANIYTDTTDHVIEAAAKKINAHNAQTSKTIAC